MFEHLKAQPADKILALTEAFRADPRPEKIDLGVGVYKNPEGVTPVMGAVKEAEVRIWQVQESKAYTSLTGDPAYGRALGQMVLGENWEEARWARTATVGGTGAIRQALELARLAHPELTVHYSDPTWPNHLTILAAMNIKHQPYRYLNEAGGVDTEGMLADLSKAGRGDLVLLHGCCHNPTGANPSPEEWQRVADTLSESGATVLIDIAYQGFGDGLEADAAPTRLLAGLPEVMIAASCSKNFGVYRERAGLLMVKSEADTAVIQGNLAALNRQSFSFPPDHGARVVTEILGDAALKEQWATELEQTRRGMLRLREALAAALREQTGSERFDFLAGHRGMFSRLGITPAQVERLRTESGIYMTADSRINIAGLSDQTVPVLARAVAAVLR